MHRVLIKFADDRGKLRETVFETDSLPVLRQSLQERGYYLLAEQPIHKTIKERVLELLPFRGGVSLGELTEFSQLMRTLLKAGLPLKDSLDVLTDEMPEGALKQALNQVKADITEGISFSRSLGRHPDVFPEIYVRTVVAGEKAGALEQVMSRLIAYFRNTIAVRRKLLAALIYPTILMIVASGAVVFMLVKVVPEFSDLFRSLDVPLPPFTQLVLGLSDFIASWFWVLLAGLLGFMAVFRQYARTLDGRRSIDRLKLRIPIIRVLEEKYAYSQFARTLSTLIQGGISLTEGLQVVIDGLQNKEILHRMHRIIPDIERGDTFAKAMKNVKGAPGAMIKVIHVGEESGNLGEMMNNLADHYDKEIDGLTSTLTSLVEPVLFLLLTTVVGSLIIALLMPVLTAASNIR
ncbi:MAG: type II secretion system F family protein [Candidatus Ozemobacteraceae bacterium]